MPRSYYILLVIEFKFTIDFNAFIPLMTICTEMIRRVTIYMKFNLYLYQPVHPVSDDAPSFVETRHSTLIQKA